MAKRTLALVAALAVATAAWAQVSLRPGQYEFIAEMQLPGAPAPTQMKSMNCITPEEAKDLTKMMTQEVLDEAGCKIANLKTAAGRMTFDATCQVEGKLSTSHSETTFGADSFTTVTTTKYDGEVITMKASGKWVAAQCTATDDDEQP